VIQKVSKKNYSGSINIPASKSDAQRAILCAGLAFGTSLLTNIGESDDEKAMLATLRRLGARIQYKENNVVEIRGIGSLMFNSIDHFEVGESGLGARLIVALASTSNLPININGKGSLLQRDFSFFEKYLPQMGVKAKSTNGKLPIQVHGPIQGGNYTVNGSESSQYISGLLMALPFAENQSVLCVNELKSSPYVDMTLQTMKTFGISIERNGDIFTIDGNQNYSASNYEIDGDWSAASCWLVASALGLDVTVFGLSMKSLQADKQLLEALLMSNCKIIETEKGISVDGAARVPFEFNLTHCPDLFPALAVFAALTPGISKLTGVSRLANKESNRGLTLQSEFGKLGCSIELVEDEMIIHGGSSLLGGQVRSHNDHRIAMCLAIAGMFTEEEVSIVEANAVAKSYPNFWDDLSKLGQ